MKTSKFWISAGLVAVALMLSVGANAAYLNAWIGTADNSAKLTGDYQLAAGQSQKFALYFQTDFDYNVADFVIGFDKSNTTSYGFNTSYVGGTDVGTKTGTVVDAGMYGVTGKLTVAANSFDVLKGWTAAKVGKPSDPILTPKAITQSILYQDIDGNRYFDATTKTALGTAREFNALYGGNAYGFDVIAMGNNILSYPDQTLKAFEFTIDSHLNAGDFQYLSIINPAQYTTSWASALKIGGGDSYLRPSSDYSLKIVNSVPEPGTIVSLLGGLVGLAGVAFRRRS